MMYTEITTRAHCRSSLGRHAFTLIELLVVIAIIAILAAILTPAVRTGINNAQINRARMEISTLLTASQSYYAEYGIWPVPPAHLGGDDRSYHATNANTNDVAGQSQARVIKALRGMDPTVNPRKISFLEVKEASMTGMDKDGNTYTPALSYFLDPWGNPYVITFDLNFDEELAMENVANWAAPTLERTRISVYSLGSRGLDWGSLSPADKNKSVLTSWKE